MSMANLLHACTAPRSCDRPLDGRPTGLRIGLSASFFEVGFKQHFTRFAFRAHTSLQALYFYLSSDSKPKAHAALVLLSAVARHSVQSARQLVHNFDFTLSALPRLSRLPRYLIECADWQCDSQSVLTQ